MTPGGLRAQYLIPNLSPKCECLSIHSSLPLRPRHHAISQNQRIQSLCRKEANCRPQAPLSNLLKKSSSAEQDFLPNQAHKSDSLLYQILVLTICRVRYTTQHHLLLLILNFKLMVIFICVQRAFGRTEGIWNRKSWSATWGSTRKMVWKQDQRSTMLEGK
jgi:hypothetical protein